MELRWQTFRLDGFDDWLPLAFVASMQTVKPEPREMLKSMISRFEFPEPLVQSVDQITDAMERIAIAHNARVRDAKTGKVIGNMRDYKRGIKAQKPVKRQRRGRPRK